MSCWANQKKKKKKDEVSTRMTEYKMKKKVKIILDEKRSNEICKPNIFYYLCDRLLDTTYRHTPTPTQAANTVLAHPQNI